MTPGTEYAFCAMLMFGIGDMIYKRGAAAGALPHHLLMTQSWVFLPAVTLYGLFSGSLIFVTGTWWGCLAGLFMWLGFYNFAYSLKSGSISVNAPIFRLSFVITVALAVIFLDESLTPHKLAGISLAPIAIWLLLGAPKADTFTEPHLSSASLIRVVVATVAVGIGNLIYKFGLSAGVTPASLIVAQAIIVVSLSLISAAVIDRQIQPSGTALRYGPCVAIILAAAFAFMVESLARGEASMMIPIAQMGFSFTALLGFLFLREPFTARKGAGLLIAFAALVVLATG